MGARTTVLLLGFSVAVAVAVLAVASGSSESTHHRLNVVVDEAANLFVGVPIRAAGQKVGAIVEAEPTRDGRARLELRIEDEKAWPVPRDSQVRLRFGGTISSNNRYVELDVGRAPQALADGATIASNVAEPLEVDQLAATLDAASRRDLKALLNRAGHAARRGRGSLRRSLE